MKLVRPLAITNANIPTLNINDLSYGFRGKFSCGAQRVVPIAQDSDILSARIANHSARDLFPNHVISVTKFLACELPILISFVTFFNRILFFTRI